MKKPYLFIFPIVAIGLIVAARHVLAPTMPNIANPPLPFVSPPDDESGSRLVIGTSGELAMATTTLVSLNNGKKFTLTHFDNYVLSVVAQGYKHLRFMAKSPDDRLFVGEQTTLDDTHTGRVIILDHWNETTKKFDGSHVYLSGQRNPHSLAFYTDDSGVTWLYVALTDKLVRYAYHNGDNAPTDKPQIIATFPDYGQPYKKGGWHFTRTVVVHNNKLYVSVGSSCNSCEEKESEPTRATILEMNPDGSNQTIFANGLRNAVGLQFVNDILFATNNNVDHLGNDRPPDDVYIILPNRNYGWPYCYEYNGQVLPDDSKKWDHSYNCAAVPLANIELPPHSAPLGITYFDNQLIVALHGSGNKKLGYGYELVSADTDGHTKSFLSGFLNKGIVNGRTVGVLAYSYSKLFVTDDFNGVIYLLEKK